MQKSTEKHIKQQIINSGISNGIFNVLCLWVFNRDMPFMMYSDIAMDTFFTTGFISCLVTFPTAYFTRKAIAAGLPPCELESHIIGLLPEKITRLWLMLWIASALFLEVVFFIYFSASKISGINFISMVMLKFIYCSIMGAFLGGLVAYRYCQANLYQRVK